MLTLSINITYGDSIFLEGSVGKEVLGSSATATTYTALERILEALILCVSLCQMHFLMNE